MRSAHRLGILLYLLWWLASGNGGISHAEVKGDPPDLSGIWWASESFIHPDGRRERWEYVVGVELAGDQLTISDGDGMSLVGTLINGTSVLRGSYPWSDGTVGHYTLDLTVRGINCLYAAGSWVNYDGNEGEPIRGAQGLVNFLFARPGEGQCEGNQDWVRTSGGVSLVISEKQRLSYHPDRRIVRR